MRIALVLVLVAAASGCSKPLDPPAATLTITQRIFEPVYRASKALQGATAPGVTYGKFGELLQNFATEIAIARDQQMNELDKKLIGLYVEVFDAYNFSSNLWKKQIERHEDYWMGYIPVGAEVSPELATKYGLVIESVKMKYGGQKFDGVNGDGAIQTVWHKANEINARATEMYYGRSTNPDKK